MPARKRRLAMDPATRARTIEKAREFFIEEIYKPKMQAIREFNSVSEFKINPFAELFLSNVMFGNESAESIAKVLLYPKIAQSLSGSMGTKLQKFCSVVLGCPGSVTPGMDIEFYDFVDGRNKLSQIKLGPATINDKDVNPIVEEFKKARRLAKTNNRKIDPEDLVIGVLYGTHEELNSPYKRLEREVPIFIGKDFWQRLTGAPEFYDEFIAAVREAAASFRSSTVVNEVLSELAADVGRSRKELVDPQQ